MLLQLRLQGRYLVPSVALQGRRCRSDSRSDLQLCRLQSKVRIPHHYISCELLSGLKHIGYDVRRTILLQAKKFRVGGREDLVLHESCICCVPVVVFARCVAACDTAPDDLSDTKRMKLAV